MKRVTGIGGVFFKTKDAEKIKDWYSKHLGIPMQSWGSMFMWRDADDKEKMGTTTWSPFKQESDYFAPSQSQFMFNYRVENLEELPKALKEEGVQVVGEIQSFDYGKFGWIMDPDGNKIELWEPIDEPLIKDWEEKTKK